MNQPEEKYCNSSPEAEGISDFCREDHLLEDLGIKKSTLSNLRQTQGFPFVRITKTERLYYLPDVREWLIGRRQNMKR
jgi:hypothetical protein